MAKKVKKQNQINPLSLKNLTLFDITTEEYEERGRKAKETIKQYKEKYGDDYIDHLLEDEGMRKKTNHAKDINTAIYHRSWVEVSGNTEWARTCQQKQMKRMKELFGRDVNFLAVYSDPNIDIEKILLEDAAYTGKWDDLPDELQLKYHKVAD